MSTTIFRTGSVNTLSEMRRDIMLLMTERGKSQQGTVHCYFVEKTLRIGTGHTILEFDFSSIKGQKNTVEHIAAALSVLHEYCLREHLLLDDLISAVDLLN